MPIFLRILGSSKNKIMARTESMAKIKPTFLSEIKLERKLELMYVGRALRSAKRKPII